MSHLVTLGPNLLSTRATLQLLQTFTVVWVGMRWDSGSCWEDAVRVGTILGAPGSSLLAPHPGCMVRVLWMVALASGILRCMLHFYWV